MPQVTVYVRNEDLPTWQAIEKKSEWLHRCLTNHSPRLGINPGEVINLGGLRVVNSNSTIVERPSNLSPAPLPGLPNRYFDGEGYVEWTPETGVVAHE